MSNTKSPNFLGFIPGPYGRDIGVHRGNVGGDDEYVFDFDASMDFAGIYHKHDRDACRAAYDRLSGRGSVPFDIFLDNGGCKIPKEKIVRPKHAVYPTLPMKDAPGIPIENWVTLCMDAENWRDRAKAFGEICASNFESAKSWNMPPEILAVGLQHLITASLEHLAEQEIDCLEAAAFYALTMHDDWRGAGLRWLKPFRSTWFRDWVQKNPGYATMAKTCRAANPDLPKWIEGGAQ